MSSVTDITILNLEGTGRSFQRDALRHALEA